MTMQSADAPERSSRSEKVWQQRVMGLIAAIVPVMVFVREASPLLCVLLLAALIGSARANGSAASAIDTLRRWLASREVLVLIAALSFMLVSVLWSPATERGAVHAIRATTGALLIVALLAFASANPQKRLGSALAGGLIIGAVLLLVNLLTHNEVRSWVGLSADPWRTNRAAVAIALLLPLALLLSWRSARAVAVALAGLSLAAIFYSSAQLAVLVAAMVWMASALLGARIVHRIVAASTVVATITMPVLVGYANAVVPASLHEKVGYGTLTIRGEIWAAFAKLIPERPFFGFGLEASNVIGKTEHVAELTERHRELLSFTHPHNAPLQIWFELGLLGALFAVVLIVLAFRAMEHLPPDRLRSATATAAGVFAVAAVSHGAWQSWWICLVGLVAVLYALLPPGPESDGSKS